MIIHRIRQINKCPQTEFGYHVKMGFRENLKEELIYQDIQIKELAQKTGISKNTISNYLTINGNLPNIESAVKIAQALGVSVEFLVTGLDRNSKPKKPQSAKMKKIDDVFQRLDEFDCSIVIDLAEKLSKRKSKK